MHDCSTPPACVEGIDDRWNDPRGRRASLRTCPSVTSHAANRRNIIGLRMTQLLRPPRLQFANPTSAVLRFQSGRPIRGKLQVISVTGGLLRLPALLDQGTRVQLMFLTEAGTVLGTAEMLSSVSGTQQPFRFVTIDENHERRLRDVIQSSIDQNQRSIVKDRAW